MSLVRRFLVIQALLLWQGGFLFYAAVVVPTGTEVLGSFEQGRVTRHVTNSMNVIGAVTLIILAWDQLANGRLEPVPAGPMGAMGRDGGRPRGARRFSIRGSNRMWTSRPGGHVIGLPGLLRLAPGVSVRGDGPVGRGAGLRRGDVAGVEPRSRKRPRKAPPSPPPSSSPAPSSPLRTRPACSTPG